MITAYRIEHSSDGIGMFKRFHDRGEVGRLFSMIGRNHGDMNTLPCELRLLNNEDIDRDSLFCAYKSKADMKKYLSNGAINRLMDNGYNVVKLTLLYTLEGQHQYLFQKKDVIRKTVVNRFYKN